MSKNFVPLVRAVVVLLCVAVWPHAVRAGGTEFPADGARNIGRGGAGMARADDPNVMTRNPALLADLWDDQALLGAHLLLVDSCFQPAGAYSSNAGQDYLQLRGERYVISAPNATAANGQPIYDIGPEPHAEVCFEGGAPFLPQLALAMKPAPNLGVAIGFFPPETSQLNQFGNRDGTVDSPNGLRPNPLRYSLAHLNVSYFSALAAVGYRPASWFRIGFALQWQLVALQARTFSPLSAGTLKPSNDVRADLFARDLFVPGVIGSIHITPVDSLDIALGAKWSDRIQSNGKLDLTAGALGTSESANFINTQGMMLPLAGSIPTTVHNQSVQLNASPIWVPQLSAGIRFADRLKPRHDEESWAKAGRANRDDVDDAMENERWDLELDVIYYLTSWQDRTDVDVGGVLVTPQTITGTLITPGGTFEAGDCIRRSADGLMCVQRRSRSRINGKDQITARLGGDYNVLPGLLALRAGASYETSGQDAEWMLPFRYLGDRIGMHGGFTVRIARKTDFSVGFAHFIQTDVRLNYGMENRGGYVVLERDNPTAYHLQPGGYDGIAAVEIPNTQRAEAGPNFVNVGSLYYNLNVVSASLVQHF